MNSRRRRFLLAAGAAGTLGALAYGTGAWRRNADAQARPLLIPPLLDARVSHQGLSLKVQAGRTEFFPGRASATLGYNGTYLGPTLRLHRGDDVEVAVANALDEDTTVHWHGLIVPGELDGGPHQVIRPGKSWHPVLPVRQPAATLFYHSHVHGHTAEQVYLGLAGVLLIADDAERVLGLPSEYGVNDLPVVLQDREFQDDRLVIPGGMMTTMTGRRGNTLLVNGTPDAVARVPRALVRLRLVNGSNARIYDLSFDDERPFHWIASEGGLLAAPVELRSLTLAPGERAEIIADFSDGRRGVLATGPDRNAMMMMGGMASARARIGEALGSREPVLAFEPAAPAATPATLPARLAERAPPDRAIAATRRRLELNMGMGAMMGGRMGGMGAGGMATHGINGRAFDMARVDERVRLGDTEIWEVSGQMMAHPFHLHGAHFQVVGRGGREPDVRDQGLRDTVLVHEPVELLVRFTQPTRNSPFMYHCHILEHEDNGMMGQYVSQ